MCGRPPMSYVTVLTSPDLAVPKNTTLNGSASDKNGNKTLKCSGNGADLPEASVIHGVDVMCRHTTLNL